MTPKQSTARLVLYVAIAMLGAANAGLATIDFSKPLEITQFALGVLITGLITARSYIDQSPTQVSLPPDHKGFIGFSPSGGGEQPRNQS